MKEPSLLEQEAPTLLRTGTYLEPFALRALGVVREDELLLDQAVDRFNAVGLRSSNRRSDHERTTNCCQEWLHA
jgi:hypothetical protein